MMITTTAYLDSSRACTRTWVGNIWYRQELKVKMKDFKLTQLIITQLKKTIQRKVWMKM